MDASQIETLLKGFSLFEDLSQEEISNLIKGYRFVQVRHHGALFTVEQPAEQFALVLAGGFKLVRATPHGSDSIMYFAMPGDLIGALVMLQPEARYPVSSIALGPATALVLSRAVFERAWTTNGVIQTRLNSILYSRMRILQGEKANSKLTLQQRIATLLVSLIGNDPGKTPVKLPVPLTRQEIADTVGATVEAVIRSMSELSQRGIIRTEEQRIELIQPKALAEIAQVA